ncbi:TniB family NTP-binding protein [Pseudomonas yamanorum]|uniref:TniB family NTP-binding protein n=1 Tax=Pseudomonas yamanorum TaxID=515393 RepID=UPI002ED57C34|nr:TniB family NTP-binding protein [Pseudomonas yamanorum]
MNRVEQRKNLNFFKNLSGPPLSLNIIAFGTHEALNAINLDTQLISRFQIFELPQWKPDEELRAFLASYEKFMPLRLPSNLASKEIVHFLSTTLELTTRNIVNRLKWAAMLAIIDGTEKIQVENLTTATSVPDLTGVYEKE